MHGEYIAKVFLILFAAAWIFIAGYVIGSGKEKR